MFIRNVQNNVKWILGLNIVLLFTLPLTIKCDKKKAEGAELCTRLNISLIIAFFYTETCQKDPILGPCSKENGFFINTLYYFPGGLPTCQQAVLLTGKYQTQPILTGGDRQPIWQPWQLFEPKL